MLRQLRHQGWAQLPISEERFSPTKKHPKTQQLPKVLDATAFAFVNYEEVLFLTNGDPGSLF